MLENPISVLNVIASRNSITIKFDNIDRIGPPHDPIFKVCVEVGQHSAEGISKTKKKAKAVACKKMLEKIIDDNEIYFDRGEIQILLKDWTEYEDEEIPIVNNQLSVKTVTQYDLDDKSVAQPDPDISKPVNTNPVQQLHEICARKQLNVEFIDIESEMIDQKTSFKVGCGISSLNMSEFGCGNNKKQARNEAAAKMIENLRKFNMDTVDELLDRKKPLKNNDDLRNRVLEYTKQWMETPQIGSKQRNILVETLDQLRSDTKTMKAINQLLPETETFWQNTAEKCEKFNEELACQIGNVIKCRLNTVMHPKVNRFGQFQFWAEYIPENETMPFLTAWGVGGDVLEARSDSIGRLLFFFFYAIQNVLDQPSKQSLSDAAEENQPMEIDSSI